jgi:hypothetical protein
MTELPGDPDLPSSPEEIKALSTHIPAQLKYAVEDFFRLPERTAYQPLRAPQQHPRT